MKRTCARCGAPFQGLEDRLFTCPQCEEEYNPAGLPEVERSCKGCSTVFTTHKKRKIYCGEMRERSCPNCEMTFSRLCSSANYRKNRCSRKCGSEWSADKRAATMMERYGVDNIMRSEEHAARVRATQVERYGALGFNTEKQRETMMDNYGVAVPAKNEEVKQRIRETQFKNYGGFAFNTEKQRETMIERYGVPANGLLSRRGKSIEEDELVTVLEPLGFIQNTLGLKGGKIFSGHFSTGKRKVPDFVNHNDKVILEYNGRYWHTDQSEADLWLAEWSRLGWRISVVWDDEREEFLEAPPLSVEELLERYPCSWREPIATMEEQNNKKESGSDEEELHSG